MPGMNPPKPSPIKPAFNQRAPRLWGWAVITILLTLGIWSLSPQQLPVTAYKLSLVTLAAVVGYWLDRSIFPYARPDESSGMGVLAFVAAMLRRAIIVGCAMLAMGLGA